MTMPVPTRSQARGTANPAYLVTADAFVFAAAALLVLLAIQVLAMSAIFPATPAEQLPPWTQAAGPPVLAGSVVIGVFGAWRAHGRGLRGSTWAGMVLGLVAGTVVMALGFWAIVAVRSVQPVVFPESSGPWDLVAVVVVSALVLVVPAAVMAVRDLRGQRESARADVLRLVALGVALLLVVGSIAIGGETAEAGIFAAGIGGAAAFSAWGAAIADRPR
jgi:hypothetical protein